MKAARYIFFYMVKPIMSIYFKLQYNFVIKSNPLKGVKGPYLVLGHHVKSDDPLFVLSASKQLVRFLVADANMDTPWKRHLFNAMGMVPFKKKRSDMKSIRKLVALVKEKEAIGLYPEGGRNWDGATDALVPATSKLVKLLGIDVYVTFYKGGYLTRPRWADYSRKGKIEFTGYQLFKAEELKKMSSTDIHRKMTEALAYNEFDWQKEEMIPFKGNNKASGIERLLYKCPKCLAEHSLLSKGNDFTCSNCEQTYHINTYGFIEGNQGFNDTHQWHQWQHSYIPRIATYMTQYTLADIRYVSTNTKTKAKSFYPQTMVTINKTHIYLKAKDLDLTLPIETTFGYSFTLMDLFEFFTPDCKHRLVFDPKKHLSNVFIIDLLDQLKENSKHE